jgi:hypothetical protein
MFHAVLASIPLKYILKSGGEMCPDLLKIALTIQNLLYFHTNNKTFFYYCEKFHWNFAIEYLEFKDHFGLYLHLNNINYLNP